MTQAQFDAVSKMMEMWGQYEGQTQTVTKVKQETPTGFVPKADFVKLEQRMGRAESRIQQQEAVISGLTTRLGMLSGSYGTQGDDPMATMQAMMGSMGRSASRTPRGQKPALPLVDPSNMQSVEEFCLLNDLDAKCQANLQSQPVEVQQYVISRGPADGNNPSAMVTSRIARCSQEFSITASISPHNLGDVENKLEEFIVANVLDENCASNLRGQSAECQIAVMSLGAAEGRNPSAMIQGRIAKWARGKL